MKYILSFLFVFLLVISSSTYSMDVDQKLDLIKKLYKLDPKSCDSENMLEISEEKKKAGELLFKSTLLSGNKDISCESCHLKEFGSADGLPIAVGVGGEGKGYDRFSNSKGVLVQRNALSLMGRGDSEFKSFFWDGKVQVENNSVITQFGDEIQERFSSPLSIAAIMPLIERDEFLGETSIIFANDIQHAVGEKIYYKRYKAVSESLKQRIINSSNEQDKKLSVALTKAGLVIDELDLSDIGNLLSIFISDKFKCIESKWDKYLSGEKSALTEEQKQGALLFYGKGRCGSCHSGKYLSDFEYHSIGVPQGSFGPHSRHRDIGRAAVTNRVGDIYRFRTPPLNGVSDTAPYGHNGAFKHLEDVVTHHYNPLEFYMRNKDYYSSDYFSIGKILNSRNALLATIDINSTDELEKLLEFLKIL